MSGRICLTGYEFAFRSRREMTLEEKREYLGIEGLIVCDRCGYASKNVYGRWFFVKLIVNYLPDTQIWCAKCIGSEREGEEKI